MKFVFEGDKVIANGFDPDLDPDQIATVFTATLRPDQPEAFLHAVATGIAGTPIASPTPSNDNETLNTVVVSPGSGPGDGGGPKIPDTAGSTDYEITLAL